VLQCFDVACWTTGKATNLQKLVARFFLWINPGVTLGLLIKHKNTSNNSSSSGSRLALDLLIMAMNAKKLYDMLLIYGFFKKLFCYFYIFVIF